MKIKIMAACIVASLVAMQAFFWIAVVAGTVFVLKTVFGF